MKRKQWISKMAAGMLAAMCAFTACAGDTTEQGEQVTPTTAQAENGSDDAAEGGQTAVDGVIDYSSYDLNTEAEDGAVALQLAGESVKITEAGTYLVSGTLADGQITVEVGDNDKVHLIFQGVSITCSSASALCILNADKVILTLAEGSQNYLTDGAAYVEDEYTACLYSKDDLTINGTGTLTVTGNYNNGIVCTNDLKVVGGTLLVSAVNNGIKGKDSMSILDGTITVTGCEDGIKCDNDTEKGQGCFTMEGGSLSITASDDGISAVTSVVVTGGSIVTMVEDKAVNCDGVTRIADGCLTEK